MKQSLVFLFVIGFNAISTYIDAAEALDGRILLSPSAGDDAQVLQKAIKSECTGDGGVIALSPGNYHLLSPIIVPCALRIVGSGWRESPQEDKAVGTWLSIDQATAPAISFVAGSKGASIAEIAFLQPGQSHPIAFGSRATSEWHPKNMPPVIAVSGVGGRTYVHNIYMHGVSRGIMSSRGGRTTINGLYGQFFDTAVTLDDEEDMSSVRDVHSWPYWSVEPAVIAYQQAHLDTIVMGRVDSAFIDDVFAYAARSGIRFVETQGGPVATGIQIGKLQCDSVAHCVDVDASGVTLMIDEMRQFGQKGIATNQPLEGADAIRVSGQVSILAGAVEARMIDVAALTLKNPSQCSNIRISSMLIDFRQSRAKDTMIMQTSGCGPRGEANEVLFGMRPAIIPRAAKP